MELLYATGMRVTELVSLPVAATRGDPETLLVRGKGDKERLVPLTEASRSALSDWIKLRDRADEAAVENGAAPSRALFPSRGKAGHLTRNRFYVLIKEIAVNAGVSVEASSETLDVNQRRSEGQQLTLRTRDGVERSAFDEATLELVGDMVVEHPTEPERVVLTRSGRLMANDISVRLRD